MISISLVIYNNTLEELKTFIGNVKDSVVNYELIIVDNSERKILTDIKLMENVKYIYSGVNLGYGKGHNLAVKNISSESKYLLICNLDVRFNLDDICRSIKYEIKDKVEAISPKFRGKGSRIPRYYPFFGSVSIRFIGKVLKIPFLSNLIEKNHLYIDEKKFIPIASGAFLIIKTDTFKKLGGFDRRMWMYIEDWDLSRRIWNNGGRIIYDPRLEVEHDYSTEGSKSLKMVKSFLKNLLLFKIKHQFPIDIKKYHIYNICEKHNPN